MKNLLNILTILILTANFVNGQTMNTDNLKLFAEKLKSKNIVSIHYNKLLMDIEQEKIKNPIEFLNYCNKAVIINEQDYSDEPKNYLEIIHRKTASIISELSFENFEFQVVLDSSISDNDSKFYDFVVSLKSNSKKYKQKSSYHLYSPSKNKYYGNKIDQQEYYKIFNKILADLQSPYRLHEVKSYQGNAVDWKVFGIIALSKEQADFLHSGGVYFTPSYESFKNKLTSKKIELAIEEYKKIGLLSHLDIDQLTKSIETVKEKENENLNDVLKSFPEVILSFDEELGNLENPYEEIVSEYSRISHQEFNPKNISDNFDLQKENVSLSFEFNDKTYETEFKVERDWIDTRFFDYMNEVISESKLNGQFYSLYGDGAELIYLTTEQYKYIRENKLLVFADEWKSQMED